MKRSEIPSRRQMDYYDPDAWHYVTKAIEGGGYEVHLESAQGFRRGGWYCFTARGAVRKGKRQVRRLQNRLRSKRDRQEKLDRLLKEQT